MKQHESQISNSFCQPSANRSNAVIPADFPITKCPPGRASGLAPLKMRAKGGSSDLNLMTRRYSY